VQGTIMACAMLVLVEIMAFRISSCAIHVPVIIYVLFGYLTGFANMSQLVDLATLLTSGLKVPSNNNSGLQVRVFYDSLMLIIELHVFRRNYSHC
jgi:hypothetical protein